MVASIGMFVSQLAVHEHIESNSSAIRIIPRNPINFVVVELVHQVIHILGSRVQGLQCFEQIFVCGWTAKQLATAGRTCIVAFAFYPDLKTSSVEVVVAFFDCDECLVIGGGTSGVRLVTYGTFWDIETM
jgi:hypothetical protein